MVFESDTNLMKKLQILSDAAKMRQNMMLPVLRAECSVAASRVR